MRRSFVGSNFSCVMARNASLGGLPPGFGRVQVHCGTIESLQGLFANLRALMEADGSPCVPLETGVEKARRVLQSRSFGEGHLHDAFVGLSCADDSVVRPRRNPPPLPLLHDLRIG